MASRLHVLRAMPGWICSAALAACVLATAACTAGRAQDADEAVAGRRVFFTQCHGCHTIGVAGTPIAPDLSRIGARLSREELERRVRDPRTHRPVARMPRIELAEAEVQALATYLSGLR